MNIYSEKLNNDVTYGLEKEQEVKSLLENKFDTKLEKLSVFDPMDFKDNKGNFFEIKSRRCNHDKYPTTMIGINKINEAKDHPDNNYFFVFVFLDGVYYYQYDGMYMVQAGGRNDRCKNEYKPYAFIPVSMLKSVDT